MSSSLKNILASTDDDNNNNNNNNNTNNFDSGFQTPRRLSFDPRRKILLIQPHQNYQVQVHVQLFLKLKLPPHHLNHQDYLLLLMENLFHNNNKKIKV